MTDKSVVQSWSREELESAFTQTEVQLESYFKLKQIAVEEFAKSESRSEALKILNENLKKRLENEKEMRLAREHDLNLKFLVIDQMERANRASQEQRAVRTDWEAQRDDFIYTSLKSIRQDLSTLIQRLDPPIITPQEASLKQQKEIDKFVQGIKPFV